MASHDSVQHTTVLHHFAESANITCTHSISRQSKKVNPFSPFSHYLGGLLQLQRQSSLNAKE